MSKKEPRQTLTMDEWVRYRDILKALSDKAAEEFRDAVWKKTGKWKGVGLGNIPRDALIDFAFALVTKYSEGASAVACEFYDELAALQGAKVPPAIPAATPDYSDVARAVNGTIKQTENEEVVSGVVGRLVKQTGQDTTLQNAIRDGSQVAWIPTGDTCAFCITLAANGWRTVSKEMLKEGHAEHIHSNCDCAYGVRFKRSFDIAGYDGGKKFAEMYDYTTDENGEVVRRRGSSKEKINAMRREMYQQNKDKINEQKRNAYEKRKERNSSRAEEEDV